MRPYRFASPALRDLHLILEHLASRNSTAGMRFLNTLDQRLRLVAQHPFMGVQRSEFGHPGLRFLVLQSYLIAYNPNATPIVVVAIRHGAQDPATLFQSKRP